VFDKTGTITTGKLIVDKIIFMDDNSDLEKKKILEFAAIAEKKSEHLIGKAIYEKIKKDLLKDLEDPDDFRAIPGRGIIAIFEGNEIIIGTERFIKEQGIFLDNNEINLIKNGAYEYGKTAIIITINHNVEAIIILSDIIKEDCKQTILELKNSGIDVIMLSGDNEKASNEIGCQAGITNVIAEVLQEEKGKVIEGLRKKGKIVAMVGDGINDAVALSKADVGFVMGSGADVAIEIGDVIILKNNLLDILTAIKDSKKIRIKIYENLIFAFIYNIIAIPFAATGHLTPAIAAITMSASSLSVLLNSFSLKKRKRHRAIEPSFVL